MKDELYLTLPNLVIGFHGCNQDTYDKVVLGNEGLEKSTNDYDWLGNGIYFWENSYQRAYDWAISRYKTEGRVIGAVIDLGYCFNLMDYGSSDILREGYDILKSRMDALGYDMPINRPSKRTSDILLRDLDCAVIQTIHRHNELTGRKKYDSVRGAFTEGGPAFPGAAFKEKTHIQICVVNPNCIKGYFRPLEVDEKYDIP